MSKNRDKTSKDSSVSFSIVDIFNSIYKIKSKLDKIQRRKVLNLKITLTQYCVLRQLWKLDGLTFKTLAAGCHCTSSTLTGVIDTMQVKGLVTRESNPNDRRSLLVKLTKEGKNLQKLASPFDIIMNSIFESLKPNEIQLLGELLQKLNKNLKYKQIQ